MSRGLAGSCSHGRRKLKRCAHRSSKACSAQELCSAAALRGTTTTHRWSVFWILFRQMLLSLGDKKLPNFETNAFLYVLFIAVLKHQSFSKVMFLNYDLFLIFLKGKQVIFRYCFFSIHFEEEKENIPEISPQQIMATQNNLCSQSCFVFYNIVLLNLRYRTLLYFVSFVFSDLSYYFWGRWTEKVIIFRLFYKQFNK